MATTKRILSIDKKKKSSNTKSKSNKPIKIVKTEKKKKKRKLSIIINILLSFLMIIGIAIMGAVIAFGAYIVINAPEFDTDKLTNKEASIFYDRYGNEIMRVGTEQRAPINYDDLPEVLIDAIVAVEDSRFFQHNGFDIVRFVKASIGQLTGQAGAGGASALTMQVAKNAFSRDEEGKIASSGVEGIIRKFNDIYISIFKIEKEYNKEEIIE